MPRYLVAAEVDKIQSFIFQSSRLREIAGASFLLNEFCKQQRHTLPGILSSDGGSFRILAADKPAADSIIQTLRRAFDEQIGGTLIATRVADKYPNTLQVGSDALRAAKFAGCAPQAVWHSPYHALCASSGEELATRFESPGGYNSEGKPNLPDERPRYLSERTVHKSDEDAARSLLKQFAADMAKVTGRLKIGLLNKPTEADTYAQFDPRQYVAYLVADGNMMGAFFDACTMEELPIFSKAVGAVTTEALLYAAAGMLMETYDQDSADLPILPLICGGDDLFVLMPAPWAIHVARRYAETYQTQMTNCVRKTISACGQDKATTGVAVVICKASYPYQTAYRYAHELLGAAKKRAKDTGQSHLIVDFVVGNDSVKSNENTPAQAYTPQEADYFLQHRFSLKDVPTRVLHQLEAALLNGADPTPIVERTKALYPAWFGYGDALNTALTDTDRFKQLLKLWDFAYKLDELRSAYLPEER